MHLLARNSASIDAQESAVDLAQLPGDIVFLSFSDSDMSALAAAHAMASDASSGSRDWPSLRIASLKALKHPYSVDLYLENTLRYARFVLIRCLGGADYWRYGADEVAALCRTRNIPLAIVPGDSCEDARLQRASTLDRADLTRFWQFFQNGGPDNMRSALALMATLIGQPLDWCEPVTLAPAMRVQDLCRRADDAAPRAFVIFYRSLYLAADIRPFTALADALAEHGFAVGTFCVTSLKDPDAASEIAAALKVFRPDVVLNSTAFSAREKNGNGVLDLADAAVLQVSPGLSTQDAWRASERGPGAADLAMNVVLPEVDGRIMAPFISFKSGQPDLPGDASAIQQQRMVHVPVADRIRSVAALAAGWARLRRKPPAEKRIALIVSDYPARGGREGYAVGLDTPASIRAIASRLRMAGYAIADLPAEAALMRQLIITDAARGQPDDYAILTLDAYETLFATLPEHFRNSVTQAWGAPQDTQQVTEKAFHFRILRADNLIVAVQPGRAAKTSRRETYHDMALPPCHAYIAFYLLMKARWSVDVMVHLGTHGTLEWLPGKAAALSADCAPDILRQDFPVIYPFIVNDPGEAAQARRRLTALTIGHMTPPLIATQLAGAAAEIESLLDEYAAAGGLDPRRADIIARTILDRAGQSGLARECGADDTVSKEEALEKLDSWLCDIKELRIGDGLHIYGDAPGEWEGLLAALAGRFVPPGPSGAPSRARADVLPTGRALYSVDPRAIPTRTAWETGSRIADDILARYIRDHGDWPRALIIDLWGSATMRTGGEDYAQALALMGVKPLWDHASSRISGFEIITAAELARPRIDVSLRISGLFRDVFPAQIALFDQAARAVAQCDEDDESNPLAAAWRAGDKDARVFGAAPQSYGTGLSDTIAGDDWGGRDDLGRAYLDAGAWAYTGENGVHAPDRFAARIKSASALIHTQDMAETDILSGAAFAEHEGGFLAASAALGSEAKVYHVDATRQDPVAVRPLKDELARIVRGRLAAPLWLEGQMRHGFRGAAEISEGISNLLNYAATSELVDDTLFQLAYDATLGDERVSAFLRMANPGAASQIARDFTIALQRGLWRSRRNSLIQDLQELQDLQDLQQQAGVSSATPPGDAEEQKMPGPA